MKMFQNNSFKIFLLKIAAFLAVVFLLDFMIGNLLKKYYFKQESGYDFLTTHSLENAKADIVIFGSSRAVNLFNPNIFEKETGMTCYNAGRVGEPIFYHYAVLKSFLKRYKPKMILLSFDAGNFSIKQDAYDKLAVLLPYYNNHPELRSIAELKGPHEKVKLVSNIYPYNSLLLSMITGNSAYGKKKYNNPNGFFPLKRTFNGPLQTFDYSAEKELDSVKINTYRSFIMDCIASNIQLVIVCPPYMINSIGTDASIIEGKKVAQEYNIKFLDYSRDTFFTKRMALFADFRHLNEKGVELFSNKVIENIRAINHSAN
jgi:hypothetical protein